MTVYTPILKLIVPAFDETPWDEDINNDLYVIDAAVGKFFGAANLVGIWLNSTSYTVGQVVVDSDDGSMWSCAIANTSAAAPTTFSSDRASNPTFWIQAASTAQEYALQAQTAATNAATSATAAATSATNAANSAAIVAGALPLSGGTMTGALTLAADPLVALGAATKQYVDARVGGTGFLPTTGGTLTGFLTLNADPTSNLHAATKQYADTKLALSGGTLTGSLILSAGSVTATTGNFVATAGTMTAAHGHYVTNNFGFYITGALNLFTFSASAGYYWQWDSTNGNLTWVVGNSGMLVARISDRLFYNAQSAVGGVGAYVNLSDDRVKHDINYLELGMVELNRIMPIRFVRNGKERQEIGFSAQNVQEIVPEAVSIFTDDLLAVSSEAVLAVTVNAVKELEQRLDELEKYVRWR